MKGYIYGPIKTSKVIKFAKTEFFLSSNTNLGSIVNTLPPTISIDVHPGLTANGQPTSNGSLSIPVANIVATDTFGFVTTMTGG